jgi:Ion channel
MRHRWLHRVAYLRRNRCGVLLAALCLFILLNPLIAASRTGATALNVGLLAILVLSVWALRLQRGALLRVGMLGLLTVLALVTARFGGDEPWLRPLALGAAVLFIGSVTVALLRYVLDPRTITTDKVFGAVAAYVLIALTFALLFGLLLLVQPGAFHIAAENAADGHLGWMVMMYFSFTVLTSTGFGEITPVTDMARSLIVIEQVLGVMYVAFLIARLANLYGRRARR